MKLRGRNYDRLNIEQKAKINKTVKRMEKVRKNDNKRLRKTIKEKLEWAKNEKKKGLEAIEASKNCININTRECLKLEGIILILSQLLREKPIEKKNNNTRK